MTKGELLINRYFGDNLRKIRESRKDEKGKKLSQERFAELLNLDRTYYGRIERGEHSASIETCFRISEALGIHISELFIDLPT